MDFLGSILSTVVGWAYNLAPENWLYFGAGLIAGLLTRVPFIGNILGAVFAALAFMSLRDRRKEREPGFENGGDDPVAVPRKRPLRDALLKRWFGR